MSAVKVIICIFSFNRGQFLENCVHSIEQCAPDAKIAVFDDDSNDTATRKTLECIAKTHAVIQPGKTSHHKLGGLYGNMQCALEYARDEDIVCFLQDDMQVVRPIDASDIQAIDAAFNRDEDLAFLHPCFLKGCNRSRDAQSLGFDSTFNAYFRSGTSQSAGQHFSAVLLARPARLLERQWVFSGSEPENDQQARALFSRIGHLYAPFAMWLPEVPAYRGKRKTLALRLAERRRYCGFFPYQIMTAPQVLALKSRPPEILPVAEDFLQCANTDIPKPWSYYPMQGSRWLKKLGSLELALRRYF